MAFNDPRNAAELFLAPARPAGRQLAKLGSLKLGIGTLSPLPGVISKTSDLTGAVRHSVGSLIDTKIALQAVSTTLSGTLTQFDDALRALQAGRVIQPNPLTQPASTGIPGANSFLQFSTLKPGQSIPASFTSLLRERKSQMQALSARLSSIFSSASFKGVSIKENFNRTPYPLREQLDLPTIPLLAQGGSVAQRDDILKDKRRFVIAGVHIGAGKPSFWSRLLSAAQVKLVPSLNPVVNQIFRDRKNAGTWSEPPSPYAAQFPYNKVQQTEAGHVIELDDTPGAERVHLFHRSGSFIEMHPDGTVVYKNMKNGYDLTMGDKFVKVSGACHISVDGNATLHSKGDVNVECDGDFNVQTKKDFNVHAKNITLRAKRTFKADGIKIDLRYINLPTSLIPIPMGGGLAPRVNIAAIKADFPKTNIDSVLTAMAKNPLDPKLALKAITLNNELVAVPPENPLSNPGIYTKKTSEAVVYRSRLFDTPEETGDFEQYSAHIGLQTTLGDVSGDPRQLGGKLEKLTGLSTETNVPAVNYLNFDDFKGRFDYPENFVLGTTSFRLRDLVDLALYPLSVPPVVGLANTGPTTSSTDPLTGETIETPTTPAI